MGNFLVCKEIYGEYLNEEDLKVVDAFIDLCKSTKSPRLVKSLINKTIYPLIEFQCQEIDKKLDLGLHGWPPKDDECMSTL